MDESDSTPPDPRPPPARPSSARPAPAGRPDRRGPTEQDSPGLRGQRERPRRPRGPAGRDGRSGRGTRKERPVSAREALTGPPAEPTPLSALPQLEFEAAGERWLVRSIGKGLFGVSAGRAPLISLAFSRPDEPERIVREVLFVARDLSALSDAQLVEALERSRPSSGGANPSDPSVPETT